MSHYCSCHIIVHSLTSMTVLVSKLSVIHSTRVQYTIHFNYEDGNSPIY